MTDARRVAIDERGSVRYQTLDVGRQRIGGDMIGRKEERIRQRTVRELTLSAPGVPA